MQSVAHSANPSTPSNPKNNILGVDLVNLTFPTGYSDEYLTQSTTFSDEYINPFASQMVSHNNIPSTPQSGNQILGVDLAILAFGTGYSDRYIPQNTVFTDEYGQECVTGTVFLLAENSDPLLQENNGKILLDG